MGKKKTRQYTTEFKAEAVKLVLDERMSATQAAKELGITQPMLSRWVTKAREEPRPGALSEQERAELDRLRRENNILRKERAILKSSLRVLREGGAVSRYRFILAENATWSIRRMCRVLEVARSALYVWLDAEPSTRSSDDLALAVHIKAIQR